jgi:hypothetical protein
MGGAQMMLWRSRGWTAPRSVTLSADVGPLDKKIRALGVPVEVLGMRPGMPNPLALLRLARWWRQDPPHVVQTWMYHADLIGGLAAKLAGGIPLAWNIRHSNQNTADEKRITRWTVERTHGYHVGCRIGSSAARGVSASPLCAGLSAHRMV